MTATRCKECPHWVSFQELHEDIDEDFEYGICSLAGTFKAWDSTCDTEVPNEY